MPDTISWSLQMSVREGRLNDTKQLVSEMVEATRRDEAGALTYEYFLSEDGASCHIYKTLRRLGSRDAAPGQFWRDLR